MKLASFSTFSHDLHHLGIKTAAEHMVALGFDAVETFDFHPTSYDMPVYRAFSAKEIRKVLDEYGLVASCHSIAVRRLDQVDEASLEDLYRQIEFAAQIGAPYFHHTLILPLTPLPEAPDYRTMLEAVLPKTEKIADRCEEYGMTCLYEPQGMYFNGIDGLRCLLEEMRLRGKKIGICGDLANSLFLDENPRDVIASFAGDVRHVHVKDILVSEQPMEGVKRNLSRGGKFLSECEIGIGSVDLKGCFDVLADVGYDGAYSLECDGDEDAMRRMIARVRAMLSKE